MALGLNVKPLLHDRVRYNRYANGVRERGSERLFSHTPEPLQLDLNVPVKYDLTSSGG